MDAGLSKFSFTVNLWCRS